MRLRRLCSDRVEGDRIFVDALHEYRAYMEARGYDPMNIRGHFVEIANLKRQDALKKVERRKKNIYLSVCLSVCLKYIKIYENRDD